MLAGCALVPSGIVACGRETERPWTGSNFPAFALPSPDGGLHDSRDYLGQPLLINFWATWCPPCRKEMADLDALHATLGPRGLRLLGISIDTDVNLVREFLRREKLGFTILLDSGQQWSASALSVPGFPTTYLVGRNGVIQDAWIGPRAWADPAIQAAIAASVGVN